MDQASDQARKVRQPDHATTPEQHPLLSLQQTVGNRAVQRLVNAASQRPGVIQRVLSPATHAFGMAAYGGLMGSWAGLLAQTGAIQQEAANASVWTMGMLANISQMQAFIGMAQAEPAPSPALPPTSLPYMPGSAVTGLQRGASIPALALPSPDYD